MLVLDGGKLIYTGSSTGTTDRLFTVTANGGTIECAGTGKLVLTFDRKLSCRAARATARSRSWA